MEFSTNYRTKPMNEFSEADINSTVKIAGWLKTFVTTAAYLSLTLGICTGLCRL